MNKHFRASNRNTAKNFTKLRSVERKTNHLQVQLLIEDIDMICLIGILINLRIFSIFSLFKVATIVNHITIIWHLNPSDNFT